MKQNDMKHVYTPIPQNFHDAFFAAAHSVKEEQSVMKRKTWILAVALAVALMAGTALALVNHYSVRQYEAGESPSAAFEAHVVELDQAYENDYITLRVGDAVFDGNVLAVAMNLTAKDPAKPVYLCPKLTAVCGDRSLGLDIQGMRGDFMSGFVFPSLLEDKFDGNYGFDVALYEDEADGDITWTFKLGVFAPNWPIKNAPEHPIAGSAEDPAYKDYMQSFRDAYDRKEILVTWGDSPVEYAWSQPLPKGMTSEEFAAMPLDEMLLRSGAFTQVDTIECIFTTKLPKDYQKGIGAGLTFPMDAYTVEFGALDISFMRVNYAFDLVFPAGISQEGADALLPIGYNLLDQDGNVLRMSAFSRLENVEARADGSLIGRFTGEAAFHLNQPKAVRFVPRMLDGNQEKTDEAHAFTVQMMKER